MPSVPLVQIEARAGLTICRINGELDAFTAPLVREALADAVDAPSLIIDLSQVRFLDSAGLGVLVGTVRRVRELGGQAILCEASRAVSRALTTVGMPRIVDIVSSVGDARRLAGSMQR